LEHPAAALDKTITRVMPAFPFLAEMEEKCAEPISRCFQCTKCSGGCPMEFAMDIHPSQVVRYIQLGLKEDLLKSNTMWVCVSCKTCYSRCPNDIDISRINDVLKEICLETTTLADKKIPAFHKAFLDSVHTFGRVYELGMLMQYKLRTGTYAQDSTLGMKMFTKGILKLIPHRIKRKQEMQKIFRIAKEKGR